MNNIFLIENHDEALKIWQEKKAEDLDLVHIDAHIDFGFPPAKPINEVFKKAGNVEELKRGLEKSIAFTRYEKDFDTQTNIGNYIYPAMRDGIVKDFYWVVPGGMKEFKESIKGIKKILIGINSVEGSTQHQNGIISTSLAGRRLIICTLDTLPSLSQKVLLDIDTDFLVTKSILKTNNALNIGNRLPWISAQDLVKRLNSRIKQPEIITIAYSVNGAYTPIIYKHIGDEVAYYFSPEDFSARTKKSLLAAKFFNDFFRTGKKEYYKKAIRINPAYRVADNNYGPLYLGLKKFSLAHREFLRILKADPKNPASLLGLGNISLRKRDFKKARRYFLTLLNTRCYNMFKQVKNQGLFGMAKLEFSLGNFKKSKGLLLRYRALNPMRAQTYYLLGYVFEKEKNFPEAVKYYKSAIQLGFSNKKLLPHILEISRKLGGGSGIIKKHTRRGK